MHSPCAIGSLLGAIATLSTEDQLEVSELEPAPVELEFLYHMLVPPLGVSTSSSSGQQKGDGGDLQKIVCFQGGVESLITLVVVLRPVLHDLHDVWLFYSQGRSNLSQPLVVAASSACLYQLAVNEGCRK